MPMKHGFLAPLGIAMLVIPERSEGFLVFFNWRHA
jgi:hypothetical protein